MFTRKQKRAIKAHWGHMKIQFRGAEVWAKKGDCWGRLYSEREATSHLAALGLTRA